MLIALSGNGTVTIDPNIATILAILYVVEGAINNCITWDVILLIRINLEINSEIVDSGFEVQRGFAEIRRRLSSWLHHPHARATRDRLVGQERIGMDRDGMDRWGNSIAFITNTIASIGGFHLIVDVHRHIAGVVQCDIGLPA